MIVFSLHFWLLGHVYTFSQNFKKCGKYIFMEICVCDVIKTTCVSEVVTLYVIDDLDYLLLYIIHVQVMQIRMLMTILLLLLFIKFDQYIFSVVSL